MKRNRPEKPDKADAPQSQSELRKERLRSALRENLRKRKAQSRSRDDDGSNVE